MNYVNPKLKNMIYESLDSDYTDMQKIICVYRKLAEIVNYSMDSYINPKQVEEYFTNPENVINVDGINNKDVVCFTFVYIFENLIKDLNLPNVKVCEQKLNKSGRFDIDHVYSSIMINGNQYNFDSLDGLIDNNDVINTKYGEFLTGITIEEVNNGSKKKLEKQLMDDIYIVSARNCFVSEQAKKYFEYEKHDYSNCSLQERNKLFLRMVQEVGCEPSLLDLNYIVRCKRLLYSREDCEKYFNMKFINDIKANKKRILIFLNEMGYERRAGHENFEHLKILEYLPEKREFCKLEIKDIKRMINNISEFALEADNIPYYPDEFPMIRTAAESDETIINFM